MNAFMNARRLLAPVVLGALVLAAPALAGEKPGYLGVMLQDLSPAMAKALQLDEAGGILVSDVVDDGPAAKAGLRDGDVIVSFNGKSVGEDTPLGELVREAAPGDKVDVVVLRDGKRTTIPVELGERSDTFAWTSMGDDDKDVKVIMKKMAPGAHTFSFTASDEDRGWLGVGIDDLTAQLGEHFGVKDGKGVLVESVADDSPAAKAGLKAGDVITRVDGGTQQAAVANTGELHEALSGTKAGDTVKIEFVRKGKQQSAEIILGEAPESEAPMGMHFFGHDGEDVVITAPKMMHRHLAPMDGHDVRIMTAPGKEIRVIRESGEGDAELQEMRSQLDQLRKELDELRKELKK